MVKQLGSNAFKTSVIYLLFLSFFLQLNEEIQEVALEPDSILESFSDQPSLTGLKGELETAVSQYINQVKELGIYKETAPRDTPCQFTTFKTPALPKKNIKQDSASPNQLLDVKFQINTDEGSCDSGTYENFSPESRGLDNPLYLSLSDCSTGSSSKSTEELYNKNSPSSENSDEDHIYENVEQHVYDTVSCPPRPKLPPKPNRLNKVPEPKLPKKALVLLQNKKGILNQERTAKKSSSSSKRESETSQKLPLVLDGSETSDLGSSGSEDTTSEEDWPLPPFPLESPQETPEDIPLPPPPPELALQQLEEKVNQAETKTQNLKKVKNTEKTEEEKKHSEQKSKVCLGKSEEKDKEKLDEGQKTNLGKKIETTQTENNSEIGEEEIYLFRTESFGKKHLKRKLSTLNKGLKAYNKATKAKDEPLRQSKFVVLDNGTEQEDVEIPSVRHSVIIELKEAIHPLSSQILSETQIRERLQTFDSKPKITHTIKRNGGGGYSKSEDGGVCVNIVNENKNNPKDSKVGSNFNEQVIEIAEDGSWEMKNVKSSDSKMESQSTDSQEIDPFTGLPLVTSLPEPEPIIASKETSKAYEEPKFYFDDEKVEAPIEINENLTLNEAPIGCTNLISELTEPDSLTETPLLSMDSIDSTPTVETDISTPTLFVEVEKENKFSIMSDTEKDEVKLIEENQPQNDEKPVKVEESPKIQFQQANLGAAIMEGYERDLKRMKENLNLPEVSLLEFGDSVKDLEIQRKNVIEQMTVKAKKKDSWIRTFRTGSMTSKETLKETSNDIKDAADFSNTKRLFENHLEKSDSKKQVSTKLENKPSLTATDEKENFNTDSIQLPLASDITLNIASVDEIKESIDDQLLSEKDKEENIVKCKNDINKSKHDTGVFLGKSLNTKQEEKSPQIKKEEEILINSSDADSEMNQDSLLIEKGKNYCKFLSSI